RLEVSLRDLRDEAVPFAAPRDRLAGEGNDDGQWGGECLHAAVAGSINAGSSFFTLLTLVLIGRRGDGSRATGSARRGSPGHGGRPANGGGATRIHRPLASRQIVATAVS